jgi:cytochrome P450
MAVATDTSRASAATAGELPPGPRWPTALQTLGWILAPALMMDRCAARFGDMFTLTLAPGGRRLVLLREPEAVRTVFTAPPDVAPSAAGATPIAPVMGPNSVITLVGPEHMRQRKLLLPPFHGERIREYGDVIEQATRREMADWPLGRPMRIHPHMQAITLEVILRAVFGVEAERMEALRAAITGLLGNATLAALRQGFRPSVDARPGGRFGVALDHLDELIFAELGRRRAVADLQERTDILSLLLLARDEDGEPMTDAELRDELVTLLLAGHETTATSLSWALERLVRHPAALERLIAEVDEGGEEYMDAVIHEILRVRPVVPTVVRVLTEPLAVGDRLLPAGTRVVPSIYLTNRNAQVYEDPRAFRPERFLGQSPETYAWIPFGGGIRRCIGASFAMYEMRTILRTVLGELRPQSPAGLSGRFAEPIMRRAITLAPGRGGRVVWERRAPSEAAA